MGEKKKSYVITVNEEYCKGCGYCQETCPKGVFEFKGTLNGAGYSVSCPVHMEQCIGCNSCVMVCPDFTLTLTESE